MLDAASVGEFESLGVVPMESLHWYTRFEDPKGSAVTPEFRNNISGTVPSRLLVATQRQPRVRRRCANLSKADRLSEAPGCLIAETT